MPRNSSTKRKSSPKRKATSKVTVRGKEYKHTTCPKGKEPVTICRNVAAARAPSAYIVFSQKYRAAHPELKGMEFGAQSKQISAAWKRAKAAGRTSPSPRKSTTPKKGGRKSQKK